VSQVRHDVERRSCERQSLMTSVRSVGGVVALCGAVALTAACGGSGGSDTTTTSAAKVTSFDIGDLTCGAARTAPVDVTWTTLGAKAVGIAVDDFPAERGGPSGTSRSRH
jgi:hypothetical protein